jgi:hypothetical protein
MAVEASKFSVGGRVDLTDGKWALAALGALNDVELANVPGIPISASAWSATG